MNTRLMTSVVLELIKSFHNRAKYYLYLTGKLRVKIRYFTVFILFVSDSQAQKKCNQFKKGGLVTYILKRGQTFICF